jgi:hypothetical protein
VGQQFEIERAGDMTKATVPALRADQITNSHSLGAGEKKEDLNDELTGGGISPSSKSCSKRKPAAGAHRDPSRLNDAAVQISQWKRPNAQKHGVFSACPTIPGEDPREFQELHLDLIDEWQPCGPSEEDAVFSLADLMWSKRRGKRFLQTNLIASTYDARSPTFDERRGFALFIGIMLSEPETAFERHASRLLTAATSDHLEQKFPRSNYQSTSEWSEAVIMEIMSVLLPAAPPSLEASELGGQLSSEKFAKIITETQLAASITHGSELLERDLDLRERLDGMIARQTKHLIQLKAMKQMLRQTSPEREDEQPRKIAGRSTSRR